MPDTEQLKQLVTKRGQVKGRLTRFENFLSTCLDGENMAQLQLRIEKLEDCWGEFEEIQGSIEALDNTNDHNAERESFESQYFDLLSKAKSYLSKYSHRTTINSNTHISADSNDSNQIPVKLPTINMPHFTGKYEEWTSFIDTFTALVDINTSLTDVQKLYYLKSALQGEAAKILQNLESTAVNYQVGLSLLKDQYQNNRLMIQRHIKALFEMPAANKDHASSLRQLLNNTLTHLRALESHELNTKSWDPLIIHLLTTKLDTTTFREWETTTDPRVLPELKHLTDFIQRKIQTLETTSSIRHAPSENKFSFHKQRFKHDRGEPKANTLLTVNQGSCRICKGTHREFACNELLNARHKDKLMKLSKARLCHNCLSYGHRVEQCRSGGCKHCSAKHNTILHITEGRGEGLGSQDVTQVQTAGATGTKTFFTHAPATLTQVVLSTAVVRVTGPTGRAVNCRALIDNGSECCYLTEQIAQQLCLKKSRQNITVSGVNQIVQNINAVADATIHSNVCSYKVSLPFLILKSITGNIPSTTLNLSGFKIPKHIVLADPDFSTPGKIDMLIGQEIFWDLLCIGQIKTHGLPTLQKTKLGWLVGGRIDEYPPTQHSTCHLTTIDRQLQSFWLLEEPPHKQHFTQEELACETHYKANTVRGEDGRYTVKMPLRAEVINLGDSKATAEKRFLQLEKRLNRDPNLKQQYNAFMEEYIELGHMEKINDSQVKSIPNSTIDFYIPHHPVFKSSSTTTKLRVVFDASSKTSSGKSLNDLQLVGPTVQPDIFSIITRFRMHTYVMTADLEKMFRQIYIDEAQRNLLKILWRDSPDDKLETYRLKTVTYGTASASYLATKTLQKLAEDERETFPEAANITEQDFYVDDLLTGSDTIEKAAALQRELIQLLARGGFNLRKWNANCSELLQGLPEQLRERQPQLFLTNEDATVKTLGLWWDAENDTFMFKYIPMERKSPGHVSKRTVLSDVARLFDPLGLVAPVIVRAKMLLQELWKLKLAWDESLPSHLHTMWTGIQTCLHNLHDVKIPRQVTNSNSNGNYVIHGFADASQRGYGAVIYLRHEDTHGKVKVTLLCSKSRVAPLHSTSLPRLELCAALLLAELVYHVKLALQLYKMTAVYWSDSTVTLAWINAEPARWITFVANRVAKIQGMSKNEAWRHVSTKDNPADLLSRGATAKNMCDSNLWWGGPAWLKQPEEHWPQGPLEQGAVPEERRPIALSTFTSTKTENEVLQLLIERSSSFGRMTRTLAHCVRFINNIKFSATKQRLVSGRLTLNETKAAARMIVSHVQGINFAEELKQLSSGGTITSHKLLNLAPFVDEAGLIRVGGRLQESSFNYDTKHPILLPKNNRVAEMIAREEHARNLHCGPQSLLYAIRQTYWPINGRNLTRRVVRSCITCFRAKPRPAEQQMGPLPAARVNPARAFLHAGVDYCGPFHIKQSRRRGATTTKAYVAVFVCLATKAVHLEVVGDLTTEAFIGALRRFVSRRGLSTQILSDNGKTFVGANREPRELQDFLLANTKPITRAAMNEGVQWKFIPPYSAHMGGIWEAAVKSLKHHLRRVIGMASLTFEEFYTVLVQVEAVLNSRPLAPLSNDPSDLAVLTPGHFLTGGALNTLPDPSLRHLPENRLSRWQRLQQLLQHFWTRWSTEYLNNLQQRSKWKTPLPALQVGTLVLLKEDGVPPLSWHLGRISRLHPGKDSHVRVASVKTTSGEVTRHVNKLCPLPVEGRAQSDQ